MFKVWSADRQQKKSVSASSIQELVRKGKTFTAVYDTAVRQVMIIGSVFMRGIAYEIILIREKVLSLPNFLIERTDFASLLDHHRL